MMARSGAEDVLNAPVFHGTPVSGLETNRPVRGMGGLWPGSPPNSTTRRGYEICAVVFRLEPMPKVRLYKIAHVIQGKTMLQAAGEGHAGGAHLPLDADPRSLRPLALRAFGQSEGGED